MPINDPGIAVNARPTDTYVTADRNNSGMQVASALAELNPKLTGYLTVKAEGWIDDQLAEGRKRAIQNAANWQQATVRGEEPLGHNPWFRRGYLQQAGTNEGMRIAGEASAAYSQWEGKDDNDPHAFPSFLANFIRERTQQIHDPDVISGLTPQLSILTNNLSQQHANYTTQRVEREGADTIYTATFDAIDHAKDGPIDLATGLPTGDFSAEQLRDRYENMRDRFYSLGMSRTRFDSVFAQAVIDKATSDLDVSYLDMLDLPRSDGTPAIGRKADMVGPIAQARNTIEARAATHAVRASQIAQHEREENGRQLFSVAAHELMANGHVSPETMQQVALAGADGVIDVSQFNTMEQAWREGLGRLNDPAMPQDMQDLPPSLILDVYEHGNTAAVVHAWTDHTITDPSLFQKLIQASTARQDNNASEARSEASFAAAAASARATAIAHMSDVAIGTSLSGYTMDVQPGDVPIDTDRPSVAIQWIADKYMAGDPTINRAYVDRVFGPGTADRLDAAKVRQAH